MRKLSVPQKINRGRHVVDTMTANAILFPNPIPALSAVTIGINALENAWNDAEDGGKTKTAIMHVKEEDLMKLMYDLAHYVERVANGDEEIVFSAGMEVKKPGHINFSEFSVEHTEHPGEVMLRVKPQSKTVYRWEYCKDPIAQNTWVAATTTDVASANIQNLTEATKYWFRVVYIAKGGETIPFNPISIIVC